MPHDSERSLSTPPQGLSHARLVARAAGTGRQRWPGDVQLSSYRNDVAVERIEAAPHGTTLHLARGLPVTLPGV